jgi:hypothetical protein
LVLENNKRNKIDCHCISPLIIKSSPMLSTKRKQIISNNLLKEITMLIGN